MILLFDRFVCRKASINMTASCSSALMLWYVHRQPQRTRQQTKQMLYLRHTRMHQMTPLVLKVRT